VSPAKKRAMIQRGHPKLSISQQCKLVRLSRSAFYYAPVRSDAETLAMMKEITVCSRSTRSSGLARLLRICAGKTPSWAVIACAA